MLRDVNILLQALPGQVIFSSDFIVYMLNVPSPHTSGHVKVKQDAMLTI